MDSTSKHSNYRPNETERRENISNKYKFTFF